MTYNLPTIDFTIPPGFYRNGTSYQQQRRWVKGNLVRFYKESATPIGGWRRSRDFVDDIEIAPLYADPSIEAARNIHTWRTNNGGVYTAIGTNRGLYVVNPSGVVDDITPVGFTPVNKNGGFSVVGYGSGFYGFGYPYGSPPIIADPDAFATDYIATWSFDNWGEDLVATITGDAQPIYAWSPGDAAAVAVPGSPADSRWIVVTDQRILMSIGSSTNIRAVEWSDSEDREDWTPAVNNQAGGLTLPGQGRLIRSINIGKDILIIGELDVYLLRYLGPPYIFGQEGVDGKYSIISPCSAIKAASSVFWWGDNDFWEYSGGRITELRCDVGTYLKAHIDPTYKSKTQAFLISQYNEVWWLYQSRFSTTGEPDSYVSYNYVSGTWFMGKLDRTCGADKTQFNYPIMVTSDGYLYDHEIPSLISDPDNTFIESGMFSINESGILFVDRIWPDVELMDITSEQESTNQELVGDTLAAVECTLIMQDTQTGYEVAFGPFDLNNPHSLRANGRYVKLRIKATDESGSFKVGSFKLEDPSNGGNRGRSR